MNKELQQVLTMELNFENKEGSKRIRNKVTSSSKSSKGQFQSVALTFKNFEFQISSTEIVADEFWIKFSKSRVGEIRNESSDRVKEGTFLKKRALLPHDFKSFSLLERRFR